MAGGGPVKGSGPQRSWGRRTENSQVAGRWAPMSPSGPGTPWSPDKAAGHQEHQAWRGGLTGAVRPEVSDPIRQRGHQQGGLWHLGWSGPGASRTGP